VYKKMKVKKVTQGDGPGLLRAMRSVYRTGTTSRLEGNFRKLIRTRQVGSVTDFAFEFGQLITFFESVNIKVNDTLAIPKDTPADHNVKLEKNEGKPHKAPYMEAIGSLMWPSCVCRPDITLRVNQLSRYSKNPSKTHWTAVKRIIAYLKKHRTEGIVFKKTTPKGLSAVETLRALRFTTYTDSDYAEDLDTRRSTTGYAIYLSGNLVDWGSHRQPVVAHSTCEAEIIAGDDGSRQTEFLRKVLHEVISIANGKPEKMHVQ
jgi:hypothetical protein